MEPPNWRFDWNGARQKMRIAMIIDDIYRGLDLIEKFKGLQIYNFACPKLKSESLKWGLPTLNFSKDFRHHLLVHRGVDIQTTTLLGNAATHKNEKRKSVQLFTRSGWFTGNATYVTDRMFTVHSTTLTSFSHLRFVIAIHHKSNWIRDVDKSLKNWIPNTKNTENTNRVFE